MPLRPRSLTTRLVAVVVLLLAVVAAVISVATTLRLSQSLHARLDDDLRGASRFGVRPPLPPDAPVLPGPRFLQPDTLTAVVEQGRVVSATIATHDGTQVAVPVDEYPDLLAAADDDRPESAGLGALGDYRLLAAAAPDGTVVVTGLPERRVQETIGTLVTIEVVVTVLALLGTGGIGLVLVRRELRPLHRVATTATRVTTLPLDRGEVSLVERVPGADPATEVGQVGLALNRMLDHVEGALAARQESETRLRQFIADASHELRTPLAAIRGYAELTRRATLEPDVAYSVSRISSQTERMTALVEDLLLLARLDAGRPLERAPVDLTRLVLDAVNDAHVAGPEHRWQLDLPEEPVVVTGDAARLTQVLANLLANARTHTPPGTAVTVALAGTSVTVVDAGPGIAPELLPHVFERFARGSSSRSREHGSTGLGLSIVHAVVAAHGGTVTVSSAPSRTEFRVTLPASNGRPAPL